MLLLPLPMRCLLTISAAFALLITSLQAAAGSEEQLSLTRRVVIASQIYSAIQLYFGHWKGVPDFDLDKEYRAYVEQIISSDDRRAFDFATMDFVAKLQNGHSGFGDKWLRDNFGQRLGFDAILVDGQWVVTRSSVTQLKVGDILTSIDGQSLESFYRQQRKYIGASDERWRRRTLFEYPYLFPEQFDLGLSDGRTVHITRSGEFQWPGSEYAANETSVKEGIAWIHIPAFSPRRFEDSAVEFLRNLTNVQALVLDLRGNHGGSTPQTLVRSLMDRPYKFFNESTPATIGLWQVWNGIDSHTELSWQPEVERPDKPLYSGPLYLLIDGGCFSACEDAVVSFKDNHRATIIGEQTAGSTGQPYFRELEDGMAIQLSTKREYFPDGSQFEGIGIKPDIEVHTTAEDIRSGRDPVMARALKLIAIGPTKQ